MTVFNDGERFLERSIKGVLAQSYNDFEFIIVNDGSTDKTDKIIRSFALKDKRIKYISREVNKGRVYSLNEGLDSCKGDLIFINDADDISESNRLEKCIEFYENSICKKDRFGVLGTAFVMNELKNNRKIIHKIKFGSIKKKKIPMWRILIGMPFPHSSFMYSKKALCRVGGFSTEVTAGIDYLTLLKIANIYDIYGFNRVLVERIVDGENFFMKKDINALSSVNSSIISDWQRDNIKMLRIKKIPSYIYNLLRVIKSS
ncbi:TPA: glycosyltransferase family 2 protein [Streptococcus suis]|nr:glycosyltransferase family 2 protein [Streptococcus suis]